MILFTFFDLFSGIGGFRLALESLGGKCLGFSEIDKSAIAVYDRNFKGAENLGDIRNISSLPQVDLVTGGVPCQPWSIAGKSLGLEDKRGQLWFDVIRLIGQSKPKAFLLENVKGLAQSRHKESLDFILAQLQDLGYAIAVGIYNSYDFGLPQNRERVYLLGVQGCSSSTIPLPPAPKTSPPKLWDIFDGIESSEGWENSVDCFHLADIRGANSPRYLHSWQLKPTTKRQKKVCQAFLLNRRKKKYGDKDGNPLSNSSLQEILPWVDSLDLEELRSKQILKITPEGKYDFANSKASFGIEGVARIILPHSDRFPCLTAKGETDFIATRTATDKKSFIEQIYRQKKFRLPSAIEYARMQGFPPNFFSAELDGVAKRQFGNAVSVPVVKYLAEYLLLNQCSPF